MADKLVTCPTCKSQSPRKHPMDDKANGYITLCEDSFHEPKCPNCNVPMLDNTAFYSCGRCGKPWVPVDLSIPTQWRESAQPEAAHTPVPVLDGETQTYHCGDCGEPLDEGRHLGDISQPKCTCEWGDNPAINIYNFHSKGCGLFSESAQPSPVKKSISDATGTDIWYESAPEAGEARTHKHECSIEGNHKWCYCEECGINFKLNPEWRDPLAESASAAPAPLTARDADTKIAAQRIRNLFEECYDSTVPGKTFDTELEKELTRYARQVREQAERVRCKAKRSGVGGNDPQDCDWPLCDCDPKAQKVIEALDEIGYLRQEDERNALAEVSRLTAERDALKKELGR